MTWCCIGLCGLHCWPRQHRQRPYTVLVIHCHCVTNALFLAVELSLSRPSPWRPAVHHRWLIIAPSIAAHCRCARGSLPLHSHRSLPFITAKELSCHPLPLNCHCAVHHHLQTSSVTWWSLRPYQFPSYHTSHLPNVLLQPKPAGAPW